MTFKRSWIVALGLGVAILSAAVGHASTSWTLISNFRLELPIEEVSFSDTIMLEMPVAKDVELGTLFAQLGVPGGLKKRQFKVEVIHAAKDGGDVTLAITDPGRRQDFFQGRALNSRGEELVRSYQAGDMVTLVATFEDEVVVPPGRQGVVMELWVVDQADTPAFEPRTISSKGQSGTWRVNFVAEMNMLFGQREEREKHPANFVHSARIPGDMRETSVCYSYGSDYIGNHGLIKKLKTKVQVFRNGRRVQSLKKSVKSPTSPTNPIEDVCMKKRLSLKKSDVVVWTHRFKGRSGLVTNIQLLGQLVSVPDQP